MALATGTPAPDFTLPTKTADGVEQVSLGDYLGKQPVVLLFFPLAFTSVCEKELCSVTGDLSKYEALDARVFAISVDSPFAQEAFARKNDLKVTLLSDFNKEVAGAYDVLFEDLLGLKGVAKRSAFVIGKDGSIVYSWSSDNPKDLPDFDALQAALKG
ncbi:MAG: redoxin domain-containing protein [Opitutales bacterium]